jgi:hypothetical protein
MKRLDHFIDSQRDSFDNQEPEEGHFDRFQIKLGMSRNKPFVWFLRIAGILLAAAFISVNLVLFRADSEDNLPPELKETAYFYSLRSEKLINDIRKNTNMSSSDKQIILKDIRSFDKEYSTLLQDLENYPGDERPINAFIDYHRSRAEFLETLVQQINTSNVINI